MVHSFLYLLHLHDELVGRVDKVINPRCQADGEVLDFLHLVELAFDQMVRKNQFNGPCTYLSIA